MSEPNYTWPWPIPTDEEVTAQNAARGLQPGDIGYVVTYTQHPELFPRLVESASDAPGETRLDYSEG